MSQTHSKKEQSQATTGDTYSKNSNKELLYMGSTPIPGSMNLPKGMTGALESLKRLFEKKISDKTLKGYNADEVKRLFGDVKGVDSLKYYYYLPNSKFPRESKSLKRQQTEQALSFLENRFSESTDLFTEIQQKEFQSGRSEIIFKGRNPKGEIIKLCILNIKRTPGETTTQKS